MKLHSIAAMALAAALTFAVAAPASASEEPVDPVTLTYEDDLGLLATPDEMVEMGATAAEVARQEKLFDRLTPTELTRQDALRQAQEAAVDDLIALPDLPEPTPPPSTTEPGTVTPYIYLAVCWPGNDYYSVYWSNVFGNAVDCFADSGTYNTIGYTYTTAVRPGNNVGRVYYPSGSYFYWSPWRGKSMDTYYFNGSGVTVQRVQIA